MPDLARSNAWTFKFNRCSSTACTCDTALNAVELVQSKCRLTALRALALGSRNREGSREASPWPGLGPSPQEVWTGPLASALSQAALGGGEGMLGDGDRLLS